MAKALYRQYRPKVFDQVLGQDKVVNVLKNQIKNKNFSHAYLFAGERGCGKTSAVPAIPTMSTADNKHFRYFIRPLI